MRRFLLVAIIAAIGIFTMAVNINTLLTCDGKVLQGAMKYECVE